MPLIAVGQFTGTEQVEENLEHVSALVRDAARAGASLLALPEYSSFTASVLDERLVAHAEALDGRFATAVRRLAAEHELHLVAGMVEKVDGGSKAYNTLLVVGADGELLSTYRKVHLFDALGFKESDQLEPGPAGQAVTFELDGLTVGVQTCYDLRFPESTRVLADAGADLVLVPAQWVPGPLKEDQWTTLLRARAIENTVYVAGAGQGRPSGSGCSMIVDPMGVVLAGMGDRSGVATATVDGERLDQVRASLPVLAGRRFRVLPR